RRFRFDVTAFVHPGEKNVIALAISAPKAGELGITFVDWNPAPPDKEMGLWQEVVLKESGPVAIRHPFVDSRLELPASNKARLIVRAELQNASDAAVKGTLHGKITGASAPVEFSQEIELQPKESREIELSPENFPVLEITQP